MFPIFQGTPWQILFLICVILLIDESKSEGRVVCYYTNWSVYRPGTAKFNPQNINPYLCTHLIYAFGGFTKDNTLKPFDKYQDIEQGGYAKFTGLKSYNKNLKTLLAIGGWNEASSRFSPLVANPDRRQQFIKNILKFLRQNHFDGLDLDWEYPAHRDGGKPRDKDNYAQFVQELRAEFDRESSKTGRQRLLITMAVPAGIEYIEKGYDIPKLNKYLDWFNILSYDYHSAYEPSVNHHAPLYSLEDESEYNYDGELNIDYTVKYYLNAGAEKDKLVLGIPTYGRSYTLINEESTEIGSPSDGPGAQGDATREKGYLAYYEICQNIKEDPDWQVTQPNPKAMGPYAFKDDQWVGYDDEAMVRKKGEYVANNGLGGIMFWSIDNDDFRGLCTGKQYPLIEAAKEALLDNLSIDTNEVSKPSNPKKQSRSKNRQNSTKRNKISSTASSDKNIEIGSRKDSTRRPSISRKRPTTTSTTPSSSLYIGRRTTPEPPTTPDPGSDFKCEEEGFFQHPRDCKKYFWCLDSGPSNLGIVAHQFTCPSGLYFNPAADSCDFSRNVLCNHKKDEITTTTTTTKPQPTTTATTNRPKITAATSRNSFRYSSPTTTTTESAYEYEDDDVVDEEEEVQHRKDHVDFESEEDPKVIKELIDLIKKVGGIEELEKLLQQDGEVMSLKTEKKFNASTTESTISKSLYDKVLRRPNSLKSFQNQFNTLKLQTNLKKYENKEEKSDTKSASVEKTDNKYSNIVRNGRPSPQNDGIEKLSEFSGFLKEKPKYVTITRTTPSKTIEENISEEDIDQQLTDEDDEITKKDNAISTKDEIITVKHKLVATTPAYKSIQRLRPITSHNTTRSKFVTGEKVKIENNTLSESKSYNTLRNRYTDDHTIETNYEEEIKVLSSPASVKIIQQKKKPIEEDTSTVNYESKDEELSTVTVHIMDNIENTTLIPTKHNIFTTSRIYSNFSRKPTTSHPIKLSVENSTTKQESQSNSLNTTGITPTTPFPLTIEPITTTINDIPTTTIIPNNTTNPLNNNFVSNTTIISVIKNSTEFYGNTNINETKQTENNFDETEKNPNTTDEVLLKTYTKNNNFNKNFNSGSFNITLENSLTNNININHSNTDALDKNTIKFNKTDIEKTNLDINKTREFHNTISKPKPSDFIPRRVRPTTRKSLIISKSDISDSLSSTENEISTKEVSFLSPFNHTSKNISMNTTVDLNLRSIVDSTKVKGEIKKLDDSLKSAHISHRKILFNNKLTQNIETPSIVSKRYSWKDARIGNYRPWHKNLNTATYDSIDDTSNTNSRHKVFTNALTETHDSSDLHLRKINNQQYINDSKDNNSSRKYRIRNNQSKENKNLTEIKVVDQNKKRKESTRLKEYTVVNKSSNLNGSEQVLKKNSTQSLKRRLDYNNTNNTSETRDHTKNLNNSLINNTALNFNFNKEKHLKYNVNNLTKYNKNYMFENNTTNSSKVVPETNIQMNRNKESSTNSTQIYNIESKLDRSGNIDVVGFEENIRSNSKIEKNDSTLITLSQFETSTKSISEAASNTENYDYSKVMKNDSNDLKIIEDQTQKNSFKNSRINKLRLYTTTESTGDGLILIQDETKKTFDLNSTKSINTKINEDSIQDLKLNRLRLKTTMENPDDGLAKIEHNIQDKEMYDNSLIQNSSKILSNNTGSNDSYSLKYSTINRNRLGTTIESAGDDLTIVEDHTQKNLLKYTRINKLRLQSTTEPTVDSLTIVQDQTKETFDSNSTKISNTKINHDSIQDFKLNRHRLKTTTEKPDIRDKEEYDESITKDSGKILSSNTDSTARYSLKYSGINRSGLETTTVSASDDLTIVEDQTQKNLLKYTRINKLRLKSTTEPTVDSLTIVQDQTKETFDSNSTKISNTKINHDSIQDFKLNRHRLKTTTEKPEDVLAKTEHNIRDKEEYDESIIKDSGKILSSNADSTARNSLKYSGINRSGLETTTVSASDDLTIVEDHTQKNLLKFTRINKLRLKPTTESTGDDSVIIQGNTQQMLDSNLGKVSNTKISHDSIQDLKLNRLRLKTTTENPDDNLAGTEHYIQDKEVYDETFTKNSGKILSSNTGSTARYSLKYSGINRSRLGTTTESAAYDLTTVEDQTQKNLLKNSRINNLRLNTTTESTGDGLIIIQEQIKKTFDLNSAETSNTKINQDNTTLTESAGYGLTILQDQTNKTFDLNSTKSSNNKINDVSIPDFTLNRLHLTTTTEKPDNDLAKTEHNIQDKEGYDGSLTKNSSEILSSNTGSTAKYSLKYSGINRSGLGTTTESAADDLVIIEDQTQKKLLKYTQINKLRLKTTTESTVDGSTIIQDQTKETFDLNSAETSNTKINQDNTTLTESAGYGLTILQDQTNKTFDLNSTKSSNNKINDVSIPDFTLNRLHLTTTTEKPDDDLAKTEHNIQDKEVYDGSLTKNSSEIFSSNTGSTAKYSLKYSAVNRSRLGTTAELERDDLTTVEDQTQKNLLNYTRINKLRLKTTTESTVDGLTILQDQTNETFDLNSAKSGNNKINDDSIQDFTLNILRLKTTTEKPDDYLARTEHNIQDKEVYDESFTKNSGEILSSNTGSTAKYSLKYSAVNRSRLGTTAELERDDLTTVEDQTQKNLLKYTRINKLRLKTTTESTLDSLKIIQDKKKETFDSTSTEISNTQINHDNVTAKESAGDGLTIIQGQTKETFDLNSSKISNTKINHDPTQDMTLNRVGPTTTTATPTDALVRTEHNNQDKEVYDNNFTKDSNKIFTSNTSSNDRYSLKYDSIHRSRLGTTTESADDDLAINEDHTQKDLLKYTRINKLRLKTTTESTGDDSVIIEGNRQQMLDSKFKVSNTKIYHDSIQDMKLNRLRFKTTTETPDDNLAGTEHYIQDKEVYDETLTKNSGKILSSNTGSTARYSLKYSGINRSRLATTTESAADDLAVIEDQTQKNLLKYTRINRLRLKTTTESIDDDSVTIQGQTQQTFHLNSTKSSNTEINDDSIQDLTLNKLRPKTTTEKPDDDLAITVQNIQEKEYSKMSVIASAITRINNDSTKPTINILKLSTDSSIGESETSSAHIQDEIDYTDEFAIQKLSLKNNTNPRTNNSVLIKGYIQNMTNSLNTVNVETFSPTTLNGLKSIADSKIDTITNTDNLLEKKSNISTLVAFTSTKSTNEGANEMSDFTTESSQKYNIRKNNILARKESVSDKIRLQANNKIINDDSSYVKNDIVDLKPLHNSLIISRPLFNKNASGKSHVQEEFIEDKTVKSYSWKDARIGDFRPWHHTTQKSIDDENVEGKQKRIIQNTNVYKEYEPEEKDSSDKNILKETNVVHHSQRKKISKPQLPEGILHKKQRTLLTDNSTSNLNSSVNTNKSTTLRYQLKTTIESIPDDSINHNYGYEETNFTNKVNQVKIPITPKLPTKTLFPSQLSNKSLFQNQRTLLKNKSLSDSITDFVNDTNIFKNNSIAEKNFLNKSTNLGNDIYNIFQNSTQNLQTIQLSQVNISNQSFLSIADNSTNSLKANRFGINPYNKNVSSFLTTPIYPLFNRYRKKDSATILFENKQNDTKNINPLQFNNSNIVDVIFKVKDYAADPNFEINKDSELKNSVNNSLDNAINSQKMKYLRRGRLLNPTTGAPDVISLSTVDYTQDKTTEDNSPIITSSNITSSNDKYSSLYRLRLKTTTESTGDDSIIIQDQTQKSLDSNSTEINNIKTNRDSKEVLQNRLRLKTTTETPDDKFARTEHNIHDTEVYDNNLTKDSSKILSNNTNSNDRFSLNYDSIVRSQIKNTTESAGNNLTIMQAQITETFNPNSAKNSNIKSNHDNTNATESAGDDSIINQEQTQQTLDLNSTGFDNTKTTNHDSIQDLIINRLRLMTTTEPPDDDLAGTEHYIQDKEVYDNNLTKDSGKIYSNNTNSNDRYSLNYNSINRSQIKNTTESEDDDYSVIHTSRLRTTTESAGDDLTIIEDQTQKNLLKYTRVNRLRLKTTTESTGDDSVIIQGQIQQTFDSNSTENNNTKTNRDQIQDLKINRLHLKTTTETPDGELARTEHDIYDKAVYDNNLTKDSGTILSSNTSGNDRYSLKYDSINSSQIKNTTESEGDDYSVINRSRLRTTTESTGDDLSIIEDHTQKNYLKYTRVNRLRLKTTTESTGDDSVIIQIQQTFDSNSTENNNTKTNHDPIQDLKINRLHLKTTTETPDAELARTEHDIYDKKVYDNNPAKDSSKIFSNNTSGNDRYSLKYSVINRSRLRTTTEPVGDDLTIIEDPTQKNLLKYTRINRLRLKTTTESTEYDSVIIQSQIQQTFDSNSTESNNTKTNHDPIQNLKINRLHLKTTTETPDGELARTEHNIHNKEVYDESLTKNSGTILSRNTSSTDSYSMKYSTINRNRLGTTTESAGDDLTIIEDQTQKNLLKYTRINKLQLKTTTESAGIDSIIIQDQTQQTLDSNSTEISNTKTNRDSIQDVILDRLRLKTTTETPDDELARTEHSIHDEEVYDESVTKNSGTILSSNRSSTDSYSLKYSTINRNRLGTTTESAGDDLTIIEDQTQKNLLKYTRANKLQLKTTTESAGDDSIIIQDQTQETFDSKSATINHDPTQNLKLNKLRLKTTTETPDDEHYIQEKEVFDESLTNESGKITSSNTGGNDKYSLKYSVINRSRLRTTTESAGDDVPIIEDQTQKNLLKYTRINKLQLKTTTETAGDDSIIIQDQTQQTFDSKSATINHDSTQNLKLNKLRLKTTTETPDDEHYIQEKEVFDESLTNKSGKITSSNTGSNDSYSLKYSVINRSRVRTTTQSASDDVPIIEDQTQKNLLKYTRVNRLRLKTATETASNDSIISQDLTQQTLDLNSTEISNTNPNHDSIQDVILNRLRLKTTTETPDDELARTEHSIHDKKVYDESLTKNSGTILSSNTSSTDSYSLKYSTINRNRLGTTTESAGDDLTIIEDQTQKNLLKYTRINKLQLKTTTESAGDDSIIIQNQTQETFDSKSAAMNHDPTQNFKLNKLRLKTTMETPDDEHYIQEKEVFDESLTNKSGKITSSNTGSNDSYSLKYSTINRNRLRTTTESAGNDVPIIEDQTQKNLLKYTRVNRLRLKTTTETASNDSIISQDLTQQTLDLNSTEISNTNPNHDSIQDVILNRLRLKTTTETPDDELARTEHSIHDKEVYDESLTKNSGKILSSNTGTTAKYSLKYSAINRSRLETTTGSTGDALAKILDQEQNTFNYNSVKVLRTRINNDSDTPDYVPETTADYDNSLTTESGKFSSSSTVKSSLKYSPKNRLLLKTTTESTGDAMINILDDEQKVSEYITEKVVNSRINNDSKYKNFRAKAAINTSDYVPESSVEYENDPTTESSKLSSSSTASGAKYSLKYKPINRLQLKTTTESTGDALTNILEEEQKSFEYNSAKVINARINNDSKFKKLRFKPADSAPDSTADYKNGLTTESGQLSTSSTGDSVKYSLKYTPINRLRLKTTTELAGDDLTNIEHQKPETFESNSAEINNAKISYKSIKDSLLHRRLLKTTTDASDDELSNTVQYIQPNEVYDSSFTTEPVKISSNNLATKNNYSHKYSRINRTRLRTTTDLTNTDSISTISEIRNKQVNKEDIQAIVNSDTDSQEKEIDKFATKSSAASNRDHNNFGLKKYLILNRPRLQTFELNSTDNINHTRKLYTDNSNNSTTKLYKLEQDKDASFIPSTINNVQPETSTEFSITNEESYSQNSNKDILEETNNSTINNDSSLNELLLNSVTESTNSFENNTMRSYNYNRSENNDIHFTNKTNPNPNPHLELSKIVNVENGTNNITSDKDNGINITYVGGFKKNNTESVIQHINNVRRFQKGDNNTSTFKGEDVNITNALHSTTSKGRRIRVLKLKRPASNSLTNNSFTQINRTLLSNEFSNIETQTQKSYTRKLIRKRPLTTISNHTDSFSQYNILQDNKTEPITPRKNFRKIIKKIIRPRINISDSDSDLNISTTSSTNINDTQEENVTVSTKSNISETLTPQNLHNNNRTSLETLKEKTFVQRRLYQPARTTAKLLTTTEEGTTISSVRKLNRNYFASKAKTTDTRNNITRNRNINFAKIDKKIQTVQTYENKEKEDNEEYDDDENDDDENNDDETDDDENDDDENDDEEDNINDVQQANINLNSPVVSISKPRDSKIKPNYVGNLRYSNQDNLNRVENKKPNFPTSYNKINVNNKQHINVLAKRPTKRPRVINRPIFTTPYPAQNQIELTNFSPPTNPSVFRSTNTRTYERKYFPSSTENSPQETPQDNPLLEDLNIDALNARNKKIFEITSKKHTTAKPKPLLIEQQPIIETNTTNESDTQNNTISNLLLIEQQPIIETNTTNENDTQNNTISNLNEHTELNNLNHLQDEMTEHTTLQLSLKNFNVPTSYEDITTLKHIFTIDKEEEPTTMGTVSDQSYHSENEGKLVEINRVIEISSQEQTLKRKPISGLNKTNKNTDLKIETPSHVDKLGEISRVKMVQLVQSNLTQSNNSEIQYLKKEEQNIIGNRETDLDYTTESFSNQIVSKSSSTLYDNNNKQSYIKKGRQLVLPEVIRGVETSTIPLEGLFDSARKSKNLELINGPVFASSLGEKYTTKNENDSPENNSISTTTEDTIIEIPTTQPFQKIPLGIFEENITTIVEDTTIPERNYNYVRPIVPLLRPESNESSPLVISIANLDKVILSKIPKTDSNVAYSAPISQVVEAPKALNKDISVQNGNNSSHGHDNIIEEVLTSFSSQTSIVRKKQPRNHKTAKEQEKS